MKFFSSIFLSIFTIATILPEPSRAEVSHLTANSIEKAVSALNHLKESQHKAGIQDADLSYAMRKALVLADLLVSQNGMLNTSLCKDLKAHFIPENPLEYETHIGRILDQLDPSWQPLLDQITIPKDPANTTHLILRALFGLSPKKPLTDRHAKVAVLAALFAPCKQSLIGDCFVGSDDQEYYKQAAHDFASIIGQGFLTRIVDKAPNNFFFIPAIEDDDIDKIFTIDRAGKIGGSNLSLLEVPGLISACQVMGGEHGTCLSQHLIKKLFSGTSAEKLQLSVSQLIETFAQIICKNTLGLDVAILSDQGKYAFSCLTNNPVLLAVESAFASMAEDRHYDSIRRNINDCVVKVLNEAAPAPDFLNAVLKNFNASYRLVYNANIPLPEALASSTAGGFQLYRRIPTMPTSIGIRVETPQDFRQLVLDAIILTGQELKSIAEADHLSQFAQTDAFLLNILCAYDCANQQEPDPINNYKNLMRTPMQSCDGNNSCEGIEQNFTPTNAKDLIRWCLDLSKKVPSELFPMDSCQHALNFAPTNPDLKAFVANQIMNSDQWVRYTLTIPGLKVSTQPIDPDTQMKLANTMYNTIAKGVLDASSYQVLVASLNHPNMTVHTYAQSLLDGINTLLRVDPNKAKDIALALDYVLMRVLPPKYRSMIEKNAIRFAIRNGNDETKKIYFCAYLNPRTQQLGFGCIDEDKCNLMPMDEDAWVNNQRWDVGLGLSTPL